MTNPTPIEELETRVTAMAADIASLQTTVAALQATERERSRARDWLRSLRRGDTTDPKPREEQTRT